MILEALNSDPIPRGDLLLVSSARWRLPPYFFIRVMKFFSALSKSNVNEKLGVVGRSLGSDTIVLMTSTRFEGHDNWGGEGGCCWVSGLGSSWWGGMIVAAAGSFSGGRRWRVGDVGLRSMWGGHTSFSLGLLDTGKCEDSPSISLACSIPFRMCRGGGSPSGILQADRRSCWFMVWGHSVAGCVLVRI